MVNDSMETEIRQALDAKAHEVDLPSDLGARTLQLAAETTKPSLRERLRARRDSWRVRAPATGYPRWMYSAAAVGAAVLLFAVGTLVTRDTISPISDDNLTAPAAETDVDSGAGQTAEDALSGEPGVAESQRTLESGEGAGPRAATTQSGETTQGQTAPDDAPAPPVSSRPGSLPPKVVRTAQIEVEVKSFDAAWSRANAIAARHGGFITNSSTEEIKDELGRGGLTMRVPAAKLQNALTDLRELGTLANQRTSGDDVSSTLLDLAARVRSLEAEELQIIELLNRTSRISEVLEIRNRLDDVRGEIESLKAQEKSFQDQVDYATINATIFEQGAEPDDDPDDGIIEDAWDTALEIGLTIVAGTVVVLGGLIPLAALGLAVWFAVRTVRRRRGTPAE